MLGKPLLKCRAFNLLAELFCELALNSTPKFPYFHKGQKTTVIKICV